MLRFFLLSCILVLSFAGNAGTIIVKNIDELNLANKNATPGDIIILKNGEWKNITIKLNCIGSEEKPITFKAETPGKVFITGLSKLKMGGEYIIVDGFYFRNGYAGDDNVISFRIDSKQLANHCTVTNTVIDDFNNPKRTDENIWIGFYGKRNRVEHCSFINKKNLGVLLAVMLDDERSRENFHSISHNYFGQRLPLASNGGEIIRVGVSQHCQYNSNTGIRNNFFENCDGEAEIISIKSCANEVEENVFKECQGSVVLRHGDYNLVAGNYFLGNDKPGTGGIRIINKGQKVMNNIFYKCRGTGFRSPLVIMNGVPNSPAHRYVQVTDALITENSFYECSPISLCEGSDSERSMPPDDVVISENLFYNTRDSIIYKIYDDIKGIKFGGNKVSAAVGQRLAPGFDKKVLPKPKALTEQQMRAIEYPSVENIATTEKDILREAGAYWYKKNVPVITRKPLIINCANADELCNQVEKKVPMLIRLTGEKYFFSRPALINSDVELQSAHKRPIRFGSGTGLLSIFIIKGNASLRISNLQINGYDIQATNFISSDTSATSDHYSFVFERSSVAEPGSKHFFYAYKSSLADSIIVRNSSFKNFKSDFFTMDEEKEDKGYYNAEKIFIGHNNFEGINGTLLTIYRGGNDESTLGPNLIFSHNRIRSCNNTKALIRLTGVQSTQIFSNNFSGCNPSGDLISYTDVVRAKHSLEKNRFSNSGRIEKNKWVEEK